MENKKITKETKESQICCTWQSEENCQGCELNELLDCRWKKSLLLRFLWVFLPIFIAMTGALVLGGIFVNTWWTFGVVTGYFTLFFIVETRILCSHCPYYSEDSKILHCLANHGFFKYCHYHPEPLSNFEQKSLRVGFVLFAVVPLSCQLINLILVFTTVFNLKVWQKLLSVFLFIALLGSIVYGFRKLFTQICVRCVNFSCPFNKVSEELVQAYLEKNLFMQKAWGGN